MSATKGTVLVPNSFATELGVRYAIQQLKASDNWPIPRMNPEEAMANVYVLAVFGQYPDALEDYLSQTLKTTL